MSNISNIAFPFITYYDPEVKETPQAKDLLEYTISQFKYKYQRRPELITSPNVVFAHLYCKNIYSDETSAGYSIVSVDYPITRKKEIVSMTMIIELTMSIGIILRKRGFLPIQLIGILYWLISDVTCVPFVLGYRTSEDDGYYVYKIVQIHKKYLIK